MLKSALIALAFVPQVHPYLSYSNSHSFARPSLGNISFPKPLKYPVFPMQSDNDEGSFDQTEWNLSPDDGQSSTNKMEMLLNEDDFSQGYIKEIINSAAYMLLPDLKDNLAKIRIGQIHKMHVDIAAKEGLNYAASYFATYVAVRFYDEVAAPLGAALLLQPRLLPSLKYKCDKGMRVPNLAELVLPDFIKDSLWFESLKTSEFPLSLEENLENMLYPTKRHTPVRIAYDLLDSCLRLSSGLKNSYDLESVPSKDQYNKVLWTLAQSLVLYQLAYDNQGFTDFWYEIYELFKSNELNSDQVQDFHDYLMSWIGISYYGEEQLFQRFHEQAGGYRRRHDFYANSFCKVLKWHRSLDVAER